MSQGRIPLDKHCDSRRINHTNIERSWVDHPQWDYAGSDQPMVKKGRIDLDPDGGPSDITAISIASTREEPVIMREVNITPLDAYTIQNGIVTAGFDANATTTPSKLINWHGVVDVTVSPGAEIESEFTADRYFWIPPGQVWNLVFNNDSALGRARWCFELEFKIARMIDAQQVNH